MPQVQRSRGPAGKHPCRREVCRSALRNRPGNRQRGAGLWWVWHGFRAGLPDAPAGSGSGKSRAKRVTRGNFRIGGSTRFWSACIHIGLLVAGSAVDNS
jgi:hypothetical protein